MDAGTIVVDRAVANPEPDLGIPDHELASLPANARIELITIMKHAPTWRMCQPTISECRMIGQELGLGWQAVYARARKYRASGDWRDLLNKAKAGPSYWRMAERAALPPAFLAYYVALCERNQRVNRRAYFALIKLWRTRRDADGQPVDAIPGYAEWPASDPAYGRPSGWSYENLQAQSRKIAHPFDTGAARIGLFAASQHQPPLLTSRKGLGVLERIEFDDHEFNVKILFPGQNRLMRPRGFVSLDTLSAHALATCFKPTLWDQETESKRALTERDFLWFVLHVLSTVGYRTDPCGTTLVVELGTAALREPYRTRIIEFTRGHVHISEPSMFGAPAHPGQFPGRGKGNFRHKPLVESNFNLIDNAFASLPAQTGKDRDHFPDDTHGREKYALATLARALEHHGADPEAHTPQPASPLPILPVLLWSQFNARALQLLSDISANPDHNIEAWSECGFDRLEWRASLTTDWLPWSALDALPAPTRQAVEAHIQSATADAPLMRARKLSRFEAYRQELQKLRDSKNLSRLSPWHWPDIVGPKNAVNGGEPLTVTKRGLIELQDHTYWPRTLYFLAEINGRHLRPGDKYTCYLDPWAPDKILIADDQGRALGFCPEWLVPARNDKQGIAEAQAEQARWINHRRAQLAARHADTAELHQHLLDHNAALAGASPDHGRTTAPTQVDPFEPATAAEFRAETSRLDRLSAAASAEITDPNSLPTPH